MEEKPVGTNSISGDDTLVQGEAGKAGLTGNDGEEDTGSSQSGSAGKSSVDAAVSSGGKRILPMIFFLLLIAAIAAGIGVYVNSDAVRFENAVKTGAQYADLQQYELAVAAFQEALSLKGDDLETQMLLLQSYAGAEDYEALESALQESMTALSGEDYILLKETAAALYEEGAERCLAAGDLDGAVTLYEKVLEISQEGSDAAQNADAQLAGLEDALPIIETQELQVLYEEELYVSDFEQLVIQIIESITTEDMTQEEKRLACYEYIIDTTAYVRTYESPEGDWTKEYAFHVLARQQGNCFRYAAAFAYMCVELDYDAKVCTGEVSARAGGTTPHGWVVLTIDGVEYLCDPDLEQSLGYDFYMKTYDEYPVKPLITQEEWEIGF